MNRLVSIAFLNWYEFNSLGNLGSRLLPSPQSPTPSPLRGGGSRWGAINAATNHSHRTELLHRLIRPSLFSYNIPGQFRNYLSNPGSFRPIFSVLSRGSSVGRAED